MGIVLRKGTGSLNVYIASIFLLCISIAGMEVSITAIARYLHVERYKNN